MVNTRTDAELAAAVRNALQTLLPQIRAEIHEEFRTGSGMSGSSGNPPSVTIHTWVERFNKQKPRSFEKAIALVDAENWISHMEKIFDVMGSAGTEEEQAKNFQWGLRRSTLNHLMCIQFTDVAQVANAARNYKILHEKDDNDAERPDKRRGGSDNHRSNNNYSGNNNMSSGNGSDQRNKGQQSNRSANFGFQQSRGPSKGYSYPKDCKQNTTVSTSGQANKKLGASGLVFAITEDHATKTSALLRHPLC
nr:zinc finger, CCHC-type, retrotransposon Gag domain protein [Tanacetum cinerariifolium]